MAIKKHWVAVGAYGYLILPFLIFCLGFIKPIFSIPASLILAFSIYHINTQLKNEDFIHFTKNELLIGILLIGFWVWLSGIGGYAFQNWDFHTRNAIFRDLVIYRWPVYYTGLGENNPNTLIYYIGYWLPSALVGKIAGWNSGQFSLYIWTFFGIILTSALLRIQTKASIPLVLMLMIFFSGMDVIGAKILQVVIGSNHYPGLWPPITHLEWWAGASQYSSFTTQLFWVFNQAIPVWICIALHLAFPNPGRSLFLLGLCFFFAPLPALGFIPFILLEIPHKTFQPENLTFREHSFKLNRFIINFCEDLKPVASFENLVSGLLIIIISYIYFSANSTSSEIRFLPFTIFSLLILLVFNPIEWLILWALFGKVNRRNLNWYFAGIILLLCPLFIVGNGQDFVMRVSIPALFFLMFWSLKALATPGFVYRPILIAVLLIGAFTPLFEINRAVFRTLDFYLLAGSHQIQSSLILQDEIKIPNNPEKSHPETLLADSIKSIEYINPDFAMNYLGNLNRSTLLKSILIQP